MITVYAKGYKVNVQDKEINYALSASVARVDEGSSVTVTLTTTGLVAGAIVPYAITGISAKDLIGALDLPFVVGEDGTAKVVLSIANDQLTEGEETLTVTLANNAASVSVVITDTSQTPAPPPPPPPPVSGALEPNLKYDQPTQHLLWDGPSGPTRDYWNLHLLLPWKNKNTGDWIDSLGVPQGTSHYAMASVSAVGDIDFDITQLAQKWQSTGENKGVMIRMVGSSLSAYVNCGGRLSNTPPLLIVETVGGVQHVIKGMLTGFDKSTVTAGNWQTQFRFTSNTTGMAQFPLDGVPSITRAVMRLTAVAVAYKSNLFVYEVDSPKLVLGATDTPLLGFAAEYPGDTFPAGHSDFLIAADFSPDGVKRLGFGANPLNPSEYLPDPDAPGTTLFRGSFNPGPPTDPLDPIYCSSSSFYAWKSYADTTDPLFPAAPPIEDNMFARLYFYLEDDWNSTRDGNKMAIGWDLRMGWWNKHGYWANTTGNGGIRGSGLKVYAWAGKNGQSQNYDCWEYQGHSIRMEAGRAAGDANPYKHMRPVQSYNYNLDQVDRYYGDMLRLGSGVIAKNRWHCIEQQLTLNSITGPYDSIGNGTAVADGILRTWLDGNLIQERLGLRWRRHPEMGIECPWCAWYYGGKHPSEMTMHYRMNHFAAARRYIGPRVAP